MLAPLAALGGVVAGWFLHRLLEGRLLPGATFEPSRFPYEPTDAVKALIKARDLEATAHQLRDELGLRLPDALALARHLQVALQPDWRD